MRTPKTYFEQIPVAVVKKIAELLPAEKEMGDGDVSIQAPSDETEPPLRAGEKALLEVIVSRRLDESNKNLESTSLPSGGAPSTADDGVSTHEDWRELARRIQVENNPDKMIELAQQLIAKFDEEKQREGPLPTRATRNRLGFTET
jgi:hypothetical protein